MKNFLLWWSGRIFPLIGLFLTGILPCSYGLVISPPSFTPAGNAAPLAGTLTVHTDIPSRITAVVNSGTTNWSRSFFDYNTSHTIPLYGFKPASTNLITVVAYDKLGRANTNGTQLQFTTAALPSDFPPLVLLTNQPAKMEPGYTLFRLANNDTKRAYLTIVDGMGQVVWYSTNQSVLDVRQLTNGDLFIPLVTNFVEMSLLGTTVKSTGVPQAYPIEIHDGVPTPHGSILYLANAGMVVTNFPTSATNPLAPTAKTNVQYNLVVEVSATNGTLLNVWSLVSMLQSNRIDYLTFSIKGSFGWDSEHANAVIEDPRDNTIIVSMRHQDAVIKFTRTGQLKWILGPHDNWAAPFQPYLLTPVGSPFYWNYGQHAPMITPQGTLLVYDDGDYRAEPYAPGILDSNNFSRAVEYSINEQAMTVSQVWDYGRTQPQPLYTDRVGNSDWLPKTGNVLINFGNVDYVNKLHPSPYSTNATLMRIKEVTYGGNPDVVFDLEAFDSSNHTTTYKGTFDYRAHRIPDLYGHLPTSIQDLRIGNNNGHPRVQFSADPYCNYSIQRSSDLQNWTAIAQPQPDAQGNFDYTDAGTSGSAVAYYRVLTH